ncbi:Hypothetical protein PBC10988_37050 [Planctomycetales bacterium 10988]|nr:Hypothetical protein PBC10988_37050 [Planctomycetales bacterium 10988]
MIRKTLLIPGFLLGLGLTLVLCDPGFAQEEAPRETTEQPAIESEEDSEAKPEEEPTIKMPAPTPQKELKEEMLEKPEGEEPAGLASLDEAIKAQLAAESLKDLGKVIGHLKKAIKDGLPEADQEFAEDMLASTLVRRAELYLTAIRNFNPELAGQRDELLNARKLALEDLKESIDLRPEQSAVYFQMGRLLGLLPRERLAARKSFDLAFEYAKTQSEKVQALMARASLQPSVDLMMGDLDQAIEIDPKHVEAYRQRGVLHLRLAEIEEALADLQKATQLDPTQLETLELYGLALAQNDQLDVALKQLDAVVKQEPERVSSYLQRAKVHLAMEKPELALKDLDKAVKLAPEEPTVRLLRAELLQEMDRDDDALVELRALLELDPTIEQAVAMQVEIFVRNERIKKAIQSLEQYLQSVPKARPEFLLQLATLYRLEGRFQPAVNLYTRLHKLFPENPEILRSRGDLYVSEGRHEEAISDYRETLKRDAKDVGALNNLAWLLSTSPEDKLRDGKEAMGYALMAASETEYEQAFILSTLAATFAEQGDFEQAMRWMDRAMAVADDDLKTQLKEEKDLYEQKKPWREVKPGDPVQDKAKEKETKKTEESETKASESKEEPKETSPEKAETEEDSDVPVFPIPAGTPEETTES